MKLEILYQTQRPVIINKPAGSLVHRTRLDPNETSFILQDLRNQLGQRVYPVHRLDKPTSGALFFALDPDYARMMSELFDSDRFHKQYLAIVRGYAPESGDIDYPVPQGDSQELKEARTLYQRLATVELPHKVGIFNTARYSLMKIVPLSGRRHQIRRHFKHIRYPILGDTRFGDRHHNRFAKEHLKEEHMFLHAFNVRWFDPEKQKELDIMAPLPVHWERMADLCQWTTTIRKLYLK